MVIFHGYVSLPEGNPLKSPKFWVAWQLRIAVFQSDDFGRLGHPFFPEPGVRHPAVARQSLLFCPYSARIPPARAASQDAFGTSTLDTSKTKVFQTICVPSMGYWTKKTCWYLLNVVPQSLLEAKSCLKLFGCTDWTSMSTSNSHMEVSKKNSSPVIIHVGVSENRLNP